MIRAAVDPVLRDVDAASFGESLVASGDLSEGDLRLAQRVAAQNEQSPIRALLDLGVIAEDVLADRLAAWTGQPRWSPDDEPGEPADAIPRTFMRSGGGLVLTRRGEADAGGEADGGGVAWRVVCVDPCDRHAWSSLLAVVEMLGGSCEVVIGTQREVTAFLDGLDARDPADGEDSLGDAIDVSAEVDQLRDLASEAPVIRMLNQIVERAMEVGASDIHLERFDHAVSLRYRVDGLLFEQAAPPQRMVEPLLCRIKIMAGLDIAERRKAQDGRVQMRLRGRMVDLRVSLLPTLYGQDAVLRIQDRQKLGRVRLEDLGFAQSQLADLFSAASKSHGMVLVTGPTGSGKTTTLYAVLQRLKGSERKLVTVEDPVEYALDGVNQVAINEAVGRTFANTLRHILRHDPDVILVGEIRDGETAQMAFQAALTGHMVLSTLHTNDAAGAFPRLVDIGVEPFLINAAVECVTAQRLLRVVCDVCRNEAARREECPACAGIGYRGRTAVMECALVDPAVKRVVREGADERQLAAALAASGFLSLRSHAERLIAAGVTDEAEVARVLGPAAGQVHGREAPR